MPTIKLSPSRTKPARLNGNGARQDYYVRDLSLADLGRREIEVAEQEMPGLMAIRAKYGPSKPLRACAFPVRCT